MKIKKLIKVFHPDQDIELYVNSCTLIFKNKAHLFFKEASQYKNYKVEKIYTQHTNVIIIDLMEVEINYD